MGRLNNVLLSQIPLLGRSWTELLAGTSLAGQPLQSVTFGQALEANPAGVGSIPLNQVDLHASPLNQVGLAALMLGALPLNQVPLNQVSGGPSPLRRGAKRSRGRRSTAPTRTRWPGRR